MSTTSFTQYAQNFMNHMAVPTSSQNVNQNINYYVNNSNVTIQNKETYNINNNILVINKFQDGQTVPGDLNQYTQQNLDKNIVVTNKYTNLNNPQVININNPNNKEGNMNNKSHSLKKDKEISLEDPKDEMNKSRFDRKGEEIKKGGKKHRVSFIDRVEKQGLIQKVDIESYKKYNASNTFAEGEIASNASSGGVSCCIIM